MTARGQGFGHAQRARWLLDEHVVYLNHGSVGATPRAVLAAQDEWRRRIEREPVRFMGRMLEGALRAAAARIAGFLGGDGEGLVFVENATAAINAVLAGIDWHPGDEIVVCREVYPGVRNAIAWHAARRGAVMRVADFPVPVPGPEAVLDALEAALGPRTRLALLDHVGSTLAAVYPLPAMIAACRRRGVPVLVDGAHAPGMLDVDLATLGADWYAGNAHKWLCAPRGCGFLWTAPQRREQTHPLVASVWHGEGYTREFDWPGTRDPSGWLAVTAAIDFIEGLGIEAMRAWQHGLVVRAAGRLARAWGTAPAAPDEMLGSMVALRLPEGVPATPHAAARVHDRLLDAHGIEVPVHVIAGALWLRVSGQVYLEDADLDRLGEAVPAVLNDGV